MPRISSSTRSAPPRVALGLRYRRRMMMTFELFRRAGRNTRRDPRRDSSRGSRAQQPPGGRHLVAVDLHIDLLMLHRKVERTIGAHDLVGPIDELNDVLREWKVEQHKGSGFVERDRSREP